jgi:hypothetical protein
VTLLAATAPSFVRSEPRAVLELLEARGAAPRAKRVSPGGVRATDVADGADASGVTAWLSAAPNRLSRFRRLRSPIGGLLHLGGDLLQRTTSLHISTSLHVREVEQLVF